MGIDFLAGVMSSAAADSSPLMTPLRAETAWKRQGDSRAVLAHTRAQVDSTPLVAASMSRDGKRVRALINDGADVNGMDRNGNTALVWAVIHGDYDITEVLLVSGAEPTIAGAAKKTPFQIAWHTQPTDFNALLQTPAAALKQKRLRRMHLALHVAVNLATWRKSALDRHYAPGGPAFAVARSEFALLAQENDAPSRRGAPQATSETPQVAPVAHTSGRLSISLQRAAERVHAVGGTDYLDAGASFHHHVATAC